MDRATYVGIVVFLGTLLFGLVQALGQDYDRGEYGGWIDSDRDCLNTRHEVLAAESLVPPLFLNCKVVTGLWFDPYTGRTFTSPQDLDVDHLVPLAEAHRSGGFAWTREKKRAYANDLENPGHLIAVELGANRRKGAKDPAGWMPPNESFHCAYVLAWIGVKDKWRLSMDEAESAAIERILRERRCR